MSEIERNGTSYRTCLKCRKYRYIGSIPGIVYRFFYEKIFFYTKLLYTAKSDGIAHPMNVHTQYHKTVSLNCKMSVALLQTHEESILPYTVKIGAARAVTTFSRNFRFFAIRKV